MHHNRSEMIRNCLVLVQDHPGVPSEPVLLDSDEISVLTRGAVPSGPTDQFVGWIQPPLKMDPTESTQLDPFGHFIARLPLVALVTVLIDWKSVAQLEQNDPTESTWLDPST